MNNKFSWIAITLSLVILLSASLVVANPYYINNPQWRNGLDYVQDSNWSSYNFTVDNLTVNNDASIVNELTVGGNASFDTDTLFVDSLNNRVGIRTSNPNAVLDVNGTIDADNINTGQGDNELYDMNQNVLTNSNVTFNTVTTTSGFTGVLQWSNLTGYPSACPAGTFVTQINDTITCTAPTAADVDPGTFPSGDYVFQGTVNATNFYQGGNSVCDNSDNCAYISDSEEANLNVNSSNYWDALNTPADINAGDITDDNTYVTVAGDNMTGNLNVDDDVSVGVDSHHNIVVNGVTKKIQLGVHGDDVANKFVSYMDRASDNHSPSFLIARARGSHSSPTIVSDGDIIGQLGFGGWDGTDMGLGAQIRAVVNGTPGSDDMPTKLLFRTTADGNTSPTTNMVVEQDGDVGIGTDSPSAKLDVGGGSATNIDGTDDLLVKDDLEVDGDGYVEGKLETTNITLSNGGQIYENATCVIIKSPAGTGVQAICD